VVDAAAERVRSTLPPDWTLDTSHLESRPSWTFTSPDGVSGNVALIALHASAPRLIARHAAAVDGIHVAPFLSPAARAVLDERRLQYADLTGNVAIRLSRPGLVIRMPGADRDPAPPPGPDRTLKGSRAARLVRALCDAPLPVTLSDLGQRTQIDLGYASRLLQWLVTDGCISRAARGPITQVDLDALLRRWADDYGVLTTHHAVPCTDPNARIGDVAALKALGFRYAFTGTMAVQRLTGATPSRPTLVYAERPEIIGALGLVPGAPTPDVVVIEPADEFVFDRTWTTGGMVFVSPSQIAVDLLTGPDEGRAAADDLIAWLKRRRE